MGVLDQLEPKSVMHWFEEISSIPRGSLKEGKIAAFIMDFAAKRGLDCSEDAYHNVALYSSPTWIWSAQRIRASNTTSKRTD